MARPLKLLFVCSRNRWRSPTAEKIFAGVNGLQTRSAGTEDGARIKVTAGHIGWANIVFVMEKKHLRRLQDKFLEELAGKRVVCLNIPDDYQFMQPELTTLLQSAVPPHLEA
ncbi:MAG: protein tyrosine phosphatase [Verrucomicrobiota bacterium]